VNSVPISRLYTCVVLVVEIFVTESAEAKIVSVTGEIQRAVKMRWHRQIQSTSGVPDVDGQ
jgi:hypothetical protein